MVLGKNLPGASASPGISQNIHEKRQLIGRLSGDMVLARPVMQVAVYNERKMAQAFGVQLDRFTDCVYGAPTFDAGGYPDYALYHPTCSLNIDKISQYIEGDENLDNAVTVADRTNSRIYAIDRYSGALKKVEVQP